MKKPFLTTLLLTALVPAAPGDEKDQLRAQIALKEKQLVELQQELAQLKGRLSTSSSAPSASASYTVKTGDTIHSIARRYQVSPDEIMKANGIDDPTKLAIGQTLRIGGTSPKPAVAPVTSSQTPTRKSKGYVVEKGDTFYSIARRHKMTLKELKALNPDVSTHLIAPGQTIMVATAPEPVAPAPKKPTPSSYRIKEQPSQTVSTAEKKPTAPAPVKKESPATETVPPKDAPLPPKTAILEKPEPKEPGASTIILDEEITFEKFAAKHGTDTDALNDLNGWSLPRSTVLARGSEIQVPN